MEDTEQEPMAEAPAEEAPAEEAPAEPAPQAEPAASEPASEAPEADEQAEEPDSDGVAAASGEEQQADHEGPSMLSFVHAVNLTRMLAPLLHLGSFSAEQLESALERPGDHATFLGQLICKLLRNSDAADQGQDAWEPMLHAKISQRSNGLDGPFGGLTAAQRAEVIRLLCVVLVEEDADVRGSLKLADGADWSSHSLRQHQVGQDASGSRFYFLSPHKEDYWVYKESADGSWSVCCRTLEDVKQLAGSMPILAAHVLGSADHADAQDGAAAPQAQEPAQEPAEEAAQEPAQEPAEEPAQEPAEEPAQEPAQAQQQQQDREEEPPRPVYRYVPPPPRRPVPEGCLPYLYPDGWTPVEEDECITVGRYKPRTQIKRKPPSDFSVLEELAQPLPEPEPEPEPEEELPPESSEDDEAAAAAESEYEMSEEVEESESSESDFSPSPPRKRGRPSSGSRSKPNKKQATGKNMAVRGRGQKATEPPARYPAQAQQAAQRMTPQQMAVHQQQLAGQRMLQQQQQVQAQAQQQQQQNILLQQMIASLTDQQRAILTSMPPAQRQQQLALLLQQYQVQQAQAQQQRMVQMQQQQQQQVRPGMQGMHTTAAAAAAFGAQGGKPGMPGAAGGMMQGQAAPQQAGQFAGYAQPGMAQQYMMYGQQQQGQQQQGQQPPNFFR